MDKPKETALPTELSEAEHRIWHKRPQLPKEAKAPGVGFGLSGGGIRSATFCLGVFQALARVDGQLDRIDYISSVSGGGFFAGFYGRLFSRPDVKNGTDVSHILSSNEKIRLELSDTTPEHQWKSEVFRWLRENGRYLAPNGSGDLLTGVTVFLRNWLTVQLLIASSFLALFLATQAIRFFWHEPGLQTAGLIWWSPFFWPAGLIVLVALMPLGWAYWTFTDPDPGTAQADGTLSYGKRLLNQFRLSFRSFLVLLSLALGLLAVGSIVIPDHVGVVTICIVELTFIFWQLALLRATAFLEARRSVLVALTAAVSVVAVVAALTARWRLLAICGALLFVLTTFAGPLLPQAQQNELLNESETARTRLSHWLRVAFVVSIAIASFALLDTAGETLYALSFTSHFRPWHWIVVGAGLVASVTPYARSLLGLITPKRGARLTLPLSLLAGTAAVVVVLPYLVLLSALSHGISYEFAEPADAPILTPAGQVQHVSAVTLDDSIDQLVKTAAATSLAGSRAALVALPDHVVAALKPSQTTPSHSRHLASVIYFLVLIGLFTFLTGSSVSQAAWVFLNRTSLHSLYAARLIRAYLGASNRKRFEHTTGESSVAKGAAGVTDPADGDDIPQEDYFLVPRVYDPPPGKTPAEGGQAQPEDIFIKGAPLHLINVAINETIDGRSNTEQRDRKGIGMAIGPAGFSAGVQHHVVFNEETRVQQDGSYKPVKIFPLPGHGYRIFGLDSPKEGEESFKAQRLSLGNWIAISGAAVSTGLGSLTSIGTSVLTAFFNVRLGFWWDSGTPSLVPRSLGGALGRWFTRLLPVQSSLLDEFLGRFRGTVRRYWYLTDGGHFENLGGYELIRRRLPLIVLVDAGADPDYEFADLANLIRKARLDFNAEIEFIDLDADKDFSKARSLANTQFRSIDEKYFGTLEQLRPAQWTAETIPTHFPQPKLFKNSGPKVEFSLAHAAIARVKYLDDTTNDEHYLILIKPTLTGDEPEDLANYHSANPTFPHQTTAEQFFDEAQWESYRRLGQHTAECVFNIR